MTAFNVVRFLVKADQEQAFVDAHRADMPGLKGLRHFSLIKTGDRRYCVIGEWDSMDALVAARPAMIAKLDGIRPMLEDLGGGLGVTDPVSGGVVAEFRP